MAESKIQPRPKYPDRKLSKHHFSFRFPQTLLHWGMAPWVAGVDRGLWGVDRLQTHVVMTGFPRSGTTLCQLMCQTSIDDLQCYPVERKGIDKARYGLRHKPFLLTKRPNDIFVLDRIRDYYRQRSANVQFVLFTRDPRAVLTSVHASRPNEFFVSPEWWRAILEFWNWNLQFDDVVTVRYEDLVQNTSEVQNTLSEFVGWKVTRPFEKFYESVPDSFDTIALNGVRNVDHSNRDRWRHPKYAERLRSLLTAELPELPDRLIEMGYESDDLWTRPYLSVNSDSKSSDFDASNRAA